MNRDLRCEHKDRIRLDLVSGTPNWCLSLGERGGMRITDDKLWGFGTTRYSVAVSRERLNRLIEGKEKVTFRFIDLGYGRKGVFLDDVRLGVNGTKADYDAYIKEKEEQRKRLKKRWSKKRYHELYDNSWFVVRTEEIKRAILYY